MIEHTWSLATMADIDEIVALGVEYFRNEIDDVFVHSTPAATRNLTFGILNQIYYPGSELITVCRSAEDNKIIAYTWAKSGDRAIWSDDLMVCIRFAHVDLSLPPRTRIKLIKDMMLHWEKFARYANNPVICSTTMRHDQAAFLKLHERAGYSVRGSYAYKRLE